MNYVHFLDTIIICELDIDNVLINIGRGKIHLHCDVEIIQVDYNFNNSKKLILTIGNTFIIKKTFQLMNNNKIIN